MGNQNRFAGKPPQSGRFLRVDVGIDPYGVKSESNTDSPEKRHKTDVSGGSMWASTPTGGNETRCDSSWSFVGADDSVRPSKFVDFSWSFVGADAHIDPSKCCEFASDFRENGRFRRVDVGIDPYGAKWETRRFFAGLAWFFIPFVGADDIESLFLTVTCRGGRLCPPLKIR